jgi:hypothetical protein
MSGEFWQEYHWVRVIDTNIPPNNLREIKGMVISDALTKALNDFYQKCPLDAPITINMENSEEPYREWKSLSQFVKFHGIIKINLAYKPSQNYTAIKDE